MVLSVLQGVILREEKNKASIGTFVNLIVIFVKTRCQALVPDMAKHLKLIFVVCKFKLLEAVVEQQKIQWQVPEHYLLIPNLSYLPSTHGGFL